MKQIFYYPSNVSGVKLNTNGTHLFGTFRNSKGTLENWSQQLPSGTWYVSQQDFVSGQILLWNGLYDIPDKFEYRIEDVRVLNHAYLNEVGEEGWELVSSRNYQQHDENFYELVFKRKIIKSNN